MTDPRAIVTASIMDAHHTYDPESEGGYWPTLSAAALDALHDHYMDDDETGSYLAACIEADRAIERAHILDDDDE